MVNWLFLETNGPYSCTKDTTMILKTPGMAFSGARFLFL